MNVLNTTLTCPGCGNKYLVPEGELHNGRALKCMSCEHQWVYTPTEIACELGKFPEAICDVPNEKISEGIIEKPEASSCAAEVVKVKKESRLKTPLKKTVSALMIISIIGNIVFWLVYFLQFSFDCSKYYSEFLKLFK